MMVMFMIALVIALFKGLDAACGCFASSEAEHMISIYTLFRDVGWLILCLYILRFDNRPLGLDRFLSNRAAPSAGAKIS